jgi:tRNA/rRNA methyltransferase
VVQLTLRVVLLEPEKPGNIGSVARAMKNFGLGDLWVVHPKVQIDGESRAYAMHGLDILTSAHTVATLDEAIKNIDLVVGTSAVTARSTSNLSRIAVTPREFAANVAESKGRIALIFGRESSGLSNQEVEKCDFMVTIPASHDYNVLNVASAASIVFYELFQIRAQRKVELASVASKHRLLAEFSRLVRSSNLQPHKRKLAERAFRNIISRSFISKRETSLLVGVFRRSAAKLV